MGEFSPEVPQYPRFLTEADLERAIGKQGISELFSDRGQSTPEERGEAIQEYLVLGERAAFAHLGANWKLIETVADVARNDPYLRIQAAYISAELKCMTKPGFISAEGTGRYAGQRKIAEEYFKALAKSYLRSSGEQAAGSGVNVGGDIQPPNVPNESRFVFAPTRAGKGFSRF